MAPTMLHYTLGQVLRETVVLLSPSPDVSLNFVSQNITTLGKTKLLYFFEYAPNLELAPTSNKRPS